VVDFGSSTSSASHFSVGSVSGLTSRQSAVVDVNSTSVALLIQGDTPRWTGANGGVWSTSSTGNWVLALAGTPTTFINGDLARFDDNATGTTITIPSPGVSPSLALFENNTTSFTLTGASGVTGTGSVTKNGSGTVTIGTVNSYTGGTLLNSGTLALTGSGTLGGASAAVTVAGGTLDLGATSTTLGPVTVSGPGTIQNGTLSAASLIGTNTSGNASVSAVLSGTGTVAMNGAGGTLTLSGANSYTGGTTINAGTLALSGSGTLGGSSASVTVAGGVLDLGTTSQALGDVTLSGAGTIQNGTLAATTLTGTNTSGTAVVAADLIGTGGVTKSGAGGILALSGANLYTGATQVNSGTLQLGNAGTTGSISVASPINLASGATFAINRTNATVQGVDFGVITGTGGLVEVRGTGNTTFNTANTYTGTTRITNGRLYVTHSQAVGTGLLNVDGFGARLQLQDNVTLANPVQTGGGAVIQSLTGNNVLNGNLTFGNLGALTTTVSTGAGSLTLNGTVSATLGSARVFVLQGQGATIVNGPVVDGATAGSSVGITKNETGTLTLRATNTYTGVTNINGGIFRVEGSLSPHPTSGATSNVEVNEAGTLAGTGVISGNVNIYGTLRPGAGGSPGGVLQFNSNSVNIDFFSGSTQFDIVGALVTGVRTTVPGAFTYNGPLRLNFTGGSYNGSYQLFDIAGGASGSPASVTVITSAGDLPLTDGGSAWTGSAGGVSYSFAPSTGVLTVSGGLTAVTPGSTTASATAGNASVALSWTAASDADTYVVRRSTTSGGPYVVAADGVAGLSYTDTLLTNGTTYYYTVQAKNSGSGLTGPISTEVSATPEAVTLSALQSWRELHFSSSENAGNGADLADPDGDGVVNLLEYATNTNPTVANAAPVVALGKDGAGTHLTLTFTRIADETLVYSVQATNDLAGTPSWTEIENFTGSENVAGSVTVTDPALISASSRRFLRLSVSYSTP
jgi:autotransporter-associated beta strand protein